MNNNFVEILTKAKELEQIEKFEKEVNYRNFEMSITNIASSFKLDEELYNSLQVEIDKTLEENEQLAFVLFFVLFTMARRQNFGNILELVNDYEKYFTKYEIIKHIRLMAVLVKLTNTKKIYREILNAKIILEKKSSNSNFANHVGFLNAFCGLICKYFEYKLDERKDQDNQKLLQFALICINKAIKLETNEKGIEKVYNKFYLNRGRILILLGQYAKGEEDILRSIELLPCSVDRDSKINEYNQYLVKSSIIHAYDLNETKVEDLDRIKVSNYKSIALMTTLLGFLLGTINIFTTVSDKFTLLCLMLGYCGLLLVLVGTILLGFSLNFKEHKKRLYVYDVLIILIGALIFVGTMILINWGK